VWKVRVVHYINQFFGQVGGEEKAFIGPFMKEGVIGPGQILQEFLGDRGEVVSTIVCGDNYFSDKMERAKDEILNLISSLKPDLILAGPAFNAGRYGIACAEVCNVAKRVLGVEAVTGMYRENPGVAICQRDIFIIETGQSSRDMADTIKKMIRLGLKLVFKEPLGTPQEEGILLRGFKRNIISKELASERAIQSLLAKIKGKQFHTEVKKPALDQILPAPPIEDLSKATIALVTEGGLIPKGNPDHIESHRATRYGRYSLEGMSRLDPEKFESIHRGYDTTYVNEDPNRLLPVDSLREMEQEGIIAKLHSYFYTTTGVATFIENSKKIGEGIAKELKEAEVTGVILTAT